MEKFVLYNNLFDIYKGLLTDNQKEIFRLYYAENLSMQEIADIEKVSKSFVGKVVNDVETKLDSLENIFHLLNYKKQLNSLKEENDINKIKSKISEIVNNI